MILKKWGNSEDAILAASQKKRRSTLLQTYLVSLMSLCLSVSMLLGTTMAWFTSTVDVPQNEIYVGTLDMDLLLDGTSLKVNSQSEGTQRKVFDSAQITWRPDHVESRSLTVVDEGEIPFTYKLTLTPALDENGKALDGKQNEEGAAPIAEEPTDEELANFRRQFNVYVKEGFHEGDITSQDLADVTVWTLVGNMQQIYEGELSVFAGDSEKMTETEVEGKKQRSAVHTIAIHMNLEYASAPVDPAVPADPAAELAEEPSLNDFQGYMLNFNIKLVANQAGAPEPVKNAEQLALMLEAGRSVRLGGDIEVSKSLMLNGGVLDGGNRNPSDDNALTLAKNEEGVCSGILTNGGTIRNLKIYGADYEKTQAVYALDLTRNLYLDQVVIDGAAYALNISDETVSDGSHKVVVTNSQIHGGISGRKLSGMDFVSCVISESESAYASMKLCGSASFTGCTFGNFTLMLTDQIPEETRIAFEGCEIQVSDGQTRALTAADVKTMLVAAADAADLSNCTVFLDGQEITDWHTANG